MKRHLPNIFFFACLALAFAVYYPGTQGYFQFDDTINIIENESIKIHILDFESLTKAAFSGNAGFLKRPISVVSFALNYYFTGLNPYYFKLTNIIIHLLNAIGIFYVSQLILGTLSNTASAESAESNGQNSRLAAAAIAAAWLFHPLNLTGVLYIVQRMTSLCAFFIICGMISYLYGRTRLKNGRPRWLWILASFVLFTPLAMLCKENGALLPPILLLIELCFFKFNIAIKATRNKLFGIFFCSVLLPLLIVITFICIHPEWITATYKIRDFTLVERCMTEARVLWFYMRLVIAPDMSQFGMYHDDIAISHTLFDPTSTIFAVVGLGILIIASLAVLKKYPVFAFGMLFFFLGHVLESSILPLEIVHEHRNYLPDFGLLFVIFYFLFYSRNHQQSLNARRGLAFFLILFFALLTLNRSLLWGDMVALKVKEVERHPGSVRANIEIAEFYAAIPPSSNENANELYEKAYAHFAIAVRISPTDTLGLFGLVKMNLRNSLPLENNWIPELTQRIGTAPFSPATGNYIQYLTNCYMAQQCNATAEIIEQLIKAALKNTSVNKQQKIQLFLVWSAFLYDVKHQSEEAEKYAILASYIDPGNLGFQLNIITLMINIQKPNSALLLIENAQNQDKLNIYGPALESLKKSALQQKKSATVK